MRPSAVKVLTLRWMRCGPGSCVTVARMSDRLPPVSRLMSMAPTPPTPGRGFIRVTTRAWPRQAATHADLSLDPFDLTAQRFLSLLRRRLEACDRPKPDRSRHDQRRRKTGN